METESSVHPLLQSLCFGPPVCPTHDNAHGLCVMRHELLRDAEDLQGELTGGGEYDYARPYGRSMS